MNPNRFTEKMREALQAAQSLAVRNSHPLVDVEHLLRALLSRECGLAGAITKASASTDLFAKRLDEELDRLPKVCGPSGGPPEQIHVTGRLNRVLTHAEDQAKKPDTIPILTSNIGSQMILGYRGDFDGYEYDRMEAAVLNEVRRFLRPGFLNRADEIILLHGLSEEHLMRIVGSRLKRLRARLAERQTRIDLTEQARRRLVHIGYDPAYGARPLQTAMQKNIENQFGRLMLEGTIRDGQPVRIDYDRDANRFTFTPQAAPATEPEVVVVR